MFLSKEIVSIIFRLINFFAFGALLSYLFYRYLLPTIKEQIAEKYAFFKGLVREHGGLIEQNSTEEREINDQKALFERLKKKIKQWKEVCKNQEELNQKEFLTIKEQHEKRINEQIEYRQQQQLLREVFPRVILGASKQLDQKFSQKKESQKFLKDLLGHMKKIIK